jgi:acetyl-CoA carboxylase beta subunit
MGSYAARVKSGAIAADPVEGASDTTQQMAAMSIRDAKYFEPLSDEPLSVRDAATLANRLAKEQKDANTPIPRGSVVQYESKLSGETITMVYMDGDWIFADADYSELDKFTIGNR